VAQVVAAQPEEPEAAAILQTTELLIPEVAVAGHLLLQQAAVPALLF
jgi:hypothetical protein